MTYYEIVDPIVTHANYVRVRPRPRRHRFGLSARERRALIELNMAIAGLLGMDPHYTISSNLAWRLSLQTGVSFRHAKRIIHARIAQHVARALRASGIVYAPHVDIRWPVYEWLESFDPSMP